MKTGRSKLPPSNTLAESRWLSLSLVTLLALTPAVLATSRGTVSPWNPGAYMAAQTGFLFEVNTTGDGDRVSGGSICDADLEKPGNQCTLRAAIQAANDNPGVDAIRFSIPASDPGCVDGTNRCTINLTKALPDLSTEMSINGPGATRLRVRRDTSDFYRIFTVTTTGEVTLSGMTISNGNVRGGFSGGGIQNINTGTVNVINCSINDNISSFSGGGIDNRDAGTVNVRNSLVARNSAVGAESNCCASGVGGGIANSFTGTVNVINSTLFSNSAVGAFGTEFTSPGFGEGGGVANSYSGTVNITNSTISHNSAAVAPGWESQADGRGGGVFNSSGTVNLKNTIIANNTAEATGQDAFGGLTSHGYNLIENASGATIVQQQTDIFGFDPKLGPLQNNGGHTQTMALLAGSPAIDKATSAGLTGALATDQRGAGFPRAVDLASIGNADGGDGTDIGAFEARPTVRFSSATYNVDEATATATITVERAGGLFPATTVRYATANATAIAGKDYTAKTGTLSFDVGEARKTFTVPIINDPYDEEDDTVKLTLGNPTGGVALGTPGTAFLKIVDNDPPPKVSIRNETVTEGNTGEINATFTVTLSAVSGKTVSVRYATANGTATAGKDYTAKTGTLIFVPGQENKLVTVAVHGDVFDEPNETFFVNLSAPVNATFADSQGLGTITDDDPPPGITITDESVREVDSGTINAVFTVKLSAASGKTVTVKYMTANGTATSPADYTAIALTTLSFIPGQTSKTVSVAVKGETLVEPNETFFVNLSAPVNATLADSQGRGIITNDD
jgi:CSLREA domain-containing protein